MPQDMVEVCAIFGNLILTRVRYDQRYGGGVCPPAGPATANYRLP